ncbi:MAG: alpha-E domain-containing protein [Phototrophicaceae bacterium]
MLSRVADSLYWMSRYLERAEHTARVIDVHLNIMLEVEDDHEQRRLVHLLDCLNVDSNLEESEDILLFLAFDTESHSAITASIASARENARQVREQLSSEMWMQLNKLYLLVQKTDTDIWDVSPHDYLIQVREGSHLFQGVTDSTMNHNQGWHFIQIGRYLERALDLLNLIDVHFDNIPLILEEDISTEHYFDLVGILKSVSAFEAYCKVYNPNVRSERIIEFLLFDQEFPRSLRFCIDTMLVSLHALSDATGRSRNSRLYRLAGRLQSNLSFDEINDIQNLNEYINNIKHQIYLIHDTLYDTYISYEIETAF